MKLFTYAFEVIDEHAPAPLTGTTKASSKDAAIADLKEFYAMELGTTPDEIQVTIK